MQRAENPFLKCCPLRQKSLSAGRGVGEAVLWQERTRAVPGVGGRWRLTRLQSLLLSISFCSQFITLTMNI